MKFKRGDRVESNHLAMKGITGVIVHTRDPERFMLPIAVEWEETGLGWTREDRLTLVEPAPRRIVIERSPDKGSPCLRAHFEDDDERYVVLRVRDWGVLNQDALTALMEELQADGGD